MQRAAFVVWMLTAAMPCEAITRTVCPSSCTHTTVQAAVTAAAYGDIIVLQANVTYTEDIVFPNKGAGSSYITITTNASVANLPPAGVRMTPVFAAYLPKLKATSNATGAAMAAGAHHYKFQYIEFLNVPNGYGAMLEVGDATATTIANLPHDILVDQCWFKGDEVDGQLRAIAWNAGAGEITNSYFEQLTAVGQDSQCIAGWNATGPLTVRNNYLECGTENIIFGGSDPSLRWRLTTTGSVSTTGANVVLAEGGGRTIADLAVGDLLAIDIAVGSTVTLEFVTISTITNIGGGNTTATLTWTPALSAIPDTAASSIRHDAEMHTLRVQSNYFLKDTAWRNPILGIPASPSAALSAGGSLSGAKYYKVVAYATGYQTQLINGLPSTEVTQTGGGGNGTITISWTAVTGADTYRVYRGTSAGAENEYIVSATSPYVDTGAGSFTSAALPTTGHKWVVKNLFEMKAATDVLVSGNILDYLWEDTNTGAHFALWLKSENQNDGGGCWSCTLRQFTFEQNLVRHVFGFATVQGRYAVNGSPIVFPAPSTDIIIRNNLVYDCNAATWGENPADDTIVLGAQNGLVNFTFDHNTIVCPGLHDVMTIDGDFDHTNFVITNNMLLRNTYGIWAGGVGEGNIALDEFAPSRTISKNAIGGAQSGNFSGNYPTNNFYPTVANWEAAFTTYVASGVGANFVIAPAHAYKGAGTDGKDLGADIAAVLLATRDTISGTPLVTADPRVIVSPTGGVIVRE